MVNFKMARHVAIFIFIVVISTARSEEGRHSRFEYKLSFKGPHLVNKQGNVPFWTHYGSAIGSDDQVRITPSLKDQRGGLWTKTKSTNEFWEVEVFFRVSGRGRVGGDGLAVWFTDQPGTQGPVFGSTDNWRGMGLFFDSFDNDGEQNNPYIMVMLNDGTKQYDHFKDGNNQQLGGCMRDFRNRPHAVRAKIRYYNNILTVFYHGGMSDREDYELCMRAENVQLPKEGFFGVTAATGGLADDHDVVKFLTHSLTPPLTEEEKKKIISEEQRKKYEEQYGEYTQKLETKKEEYQKEHPEKKPVQEKYESVYERDIRMVYEGQNAVHLIVRDLHSKTGRLTQEINNLHTAVNQKTTATGDSGGGATKQEINTLISLENQVHTIVRDLQSRDSGGDRRKIEQIEQNLRTVLENVGHLLAKTQSQDSGRKPSCPTVNCVTSGSFMSFLIVQVVMFVGYQMYKNYQDQAAKKFY